MLLAGKSACRSTSGPPYDTLEPALTAGAAAFLRNGPVSRARRPGIALGVLT
jgi:hypothetical protein